LKCTLLDILSIYYSPSPNDLVAVVAVVVTHALATTSASQPETWGRNKNAPQRG
jgi:hypothetical protein